MSKAAKPVEISNRKNFANSAGQIQIATWTMLQFDGMRKIRVLKYSEAICDSIEELERLHSR